MFEIKKSNIHGLGVFATENIKTGTRIYDYYGELMKWKDFTTKYGKYKYNSLNTYPMRRTWQIIVAKEEPYKSNNMVNFINESLEPNVFLKNKGLYSKREILAGEELLLSYPKDYYRTYLLNHQK